MSAYSQNKWIGQFDLSQIDCEAKEVCYNINIKNIESPDWILGDQNYRFFFDAQAVSVLSVTSLLPSDVYSEAVVDEILEIVGQGQELYSPLDDIDSNLGFLDFSIVAFNKQDLANAFTITENGVHAVAEICFEVSDEIIDNGGENSSMNVYFSRPSVAGQITNQICSITELYAPNATQNTNNKGYIDLTYHTNSDADLAAVCAAISSNEEVIYKQLDVYPNPIEQGGVLKYELPQDMNIEHSISIHNLAGMLLKSYDNLRGENKTILLPKDLSAGLYLFSIKTQNHVFVEELVITKK